MGGVPYVHGKAYVELVKGIWVVQIQQEFQHKLFSGAPDPTAALINKPGQVIRTELILPDAGDIALLYAFAVHHREHAGDLVEPLGKCHRFNSLDYTD